MAVVPSFGLLREGRASVPVSVAWHRRLFSEPEINGQSGRDLLNVIPRIVKIIERGEEERIGNDEEERDDDNEEERDDDEDTVTQSLTPVDLK